MPDAVECSNFRLEQIRLGFLRDFRAGQFFDGDDTPRAAVTGFIQVVSAGGTNDSCNAVDRVERATDWICAR